MQTYDEQTIIFFPPDNPPGEDGVYLVQFRLGEDVFNGFAMFSGDTFSYLFPSGCDLPVIAWAE